MELLVTLRGKPLFWLFATLACIVLENIPSVDTYVQQLFFQHGEWLISKAFHNNHKFLLYTGPKIILVCIGAAFLFLFGATFFFQFDKAQLRQWRKPALLIVLSLVFIPLAIFTLKWLTGVYSPIDVLPFGGKHQHIGFISHLYTYGTVGGGRSFPAGHASGGFALMALYYLPVRNVMRKFLLSLGLLAGWSMGVYQMARGEHFLSHTLTTMFLALVVITFCEKAHSLLRKIVTLATRLCNLSFLSM